MKFDLIISDKKIYIKLKLDIFFKKNYFKIHNYVFERK